MGQYYHPTLIGKNHRIHYLYSHEYDNGLKLTEHSYIGNNFVNAVLSQIYKNPMSVAWIGDYSDHPYSGEEPYQTRISKGRFKSVFSRVYGKDCEKRKIHPEPLKGFDNLPDFKGWYFVNHTQKIYVDLSSYIEKNKWHEEGDTWKGEHYSYDMCFNPLPLLTACGNNRGGGDYYDSHPDFGKVGTWAFDLIEFTDEAPKDYTAVTYCFTEEG